MKHFRLWLLIGVIWAVAPVRDAGAQSPYPERDGIVANGTTMALSTERINREFDERIGGPYGLRGLVLVVDSCAPDPEVYVDGALVHYGLSGGPGEINNDAVAWLVCLQPRFAGLFFAAENPAAGKLDAQRAHDAMLGNLQAGNFTGAVTGAFDVMADELSDGPGSASAAVDGAVASGSATDSAVENWVVGGVSLETWLVVLVCGAGVYWLWRRQRPAEAVVVARPEVTPLEALRGKVAELGQRLTPESQGLARLVLAYDKGHKGDEAILALNRRHEEMVGRRAALEARVAGLEEGSGAESAGGEDLKRAVAEVEALATYADELDVAADRAEQAILDAPVMAVQARKTIAAAEAEYAVAAGGGVLPASAVGAAMPLRRELPAAEVAFAFPVGLVAAAEARLTAGDRLGAGALAGTAGDLAETIAGLARSLREREAGVVDAAGLFGRIDDFAESSWSDIKGNGSEAEESLDAAVELWRRVQAVPVDVAAAGQVADGLRRVAGELERAKVLTDAIVERLKTLEAAKAEAHAQWVAIRKEIDEARSWIRQPEVDPDVDEAPIGALDEAERMLAAARSDMGGPRPDWLAVGRAIQAADRRADEALADARGQQERTGAARRQVEGARTAARSSLDRAERYLAAHQGDAAPTSVTAVADARELLREAEAGEAEGDLKAVADAYARAGRKGEDAYAALSADVSRADQRRSERYVPRNDWLPTVIRSLPAGDMGRWMDLGGPSRWGGRYAERGGAPPTVLGGGGGHGGGSGSSSRRGGGGGW